MSGFDSVKLGKPIRAILRNKSVFNRGFRRHRDLDHRLYPCCNSQRGDRHYTALFSNTARAHQAQRTDDSVLYFDRRWGTSMHGDYGDARPTERGAHRSWV